MFIVSFHTLPGIQAKKKKKFIVSIALLICFKVLSHLSSTKCSVNTKTVFNVFGRFIHVISTSSESSFLI